MKRAKRTRRWTAQQLAEFAGCTVRQIQLLEKVGAIKSRRGFGNKRMYEDLAIDTVVNAVRTGTLITPKEAAEILATRAPGRPARWPAPIKPGGKSVF